MFGWIKKVFRKEKKAENSAEVRPSREWQRSCGSASVENRNEPYRGGSPDWLSASAGFSSFGSDSSSCDSGSSSCDCSSNSSSCD